MIDQLVSTIIDVHIGLALPHYDFSSLPGPSDPASSRQPWSAIVDAATRARTLGFSTLWYSDHLFLDLQRYGGRPGHWPAFEAVTSLAALARLVPDVRLGTLVVCEALRPATVLAKALATLDRVCDGRLDVGIGAGWLADEYSAIGMSLPRPGERLRRLEEAIEVVDALLTRPPVTYRGAIHHAVHAPNEPGPVQHPRPPIFVGGKGDRLLDLVARKADGWNIVWALTTDEYRERLRVLDAACARHDRDPATVRRTVGLSTLVARDEAELIARFADMRQRTPDGVLEGIELDDWRQGRLVGTVEEVRTALRGWNALGVEELIVSCGPLPFSLTGLDQLDLIAEAMNGV